MDQYHVHYMLSFFNKERPVSVAQLLHIFQGKRTPSMFYLAEINGWHHAFAQFKYVTTKEIEKIVDFLLHEMWLERVEKGFVLTKKGKEESADYFSQHYFPKINRFTNLTIRLPFWERLQLFVQTFSELSHQNSRYSPVIKHPHHQENVRQLFRQFHDEKELLLQNWIEEQYFLFSQLDEDDGNILAKQLSGNQKVGETRSQVSEQFDMEPLEFAFYHQDIIEKLIQQIRQHSKQVPIAYAILEQLEVETNFGLSASTNESYHLLKRNYSIREIAKRRYLKENTIKEHILEMAFVLNDFPIEKFVPSTRYHELKQAFIANENYSYQQAKEEDPDIEFMHVRLVELERLRSDE